MLKNLIATISLLIIFGFNIYAQDKCNIYSEPSVGVTLCAPQKWTVLKKEGEPFADIFGEINKGQTPNINMRIAYIAVSLSEYVDGASDFILKNQGRLGITNVKVKNRSDFVASIKGIRVVYDAEVNEMNLRVIQYYFKGLGEAKIILTATLPLSNADELEKVVDESFKTFKVDNKPIRIGTK